VKNCVAYIDDLEQNLECIQQILDPEFDVKTYNNPYNFLETYESNSYSSIILDIHMPLMNGFLLYEKIVAHPQYNGCPILFMSSDDSDSVRIQSLILGAVDFISRDADPIEILGRVKSKISYYKQHRCVLELGNLKVNLKLLKTYINLQEVALTFIELKLLCFFLKAYPENLSKTQIIEKVWSNSLVLDATIFTHLSNLNGKIEKWHFEIQGVKTKGFRIVKKGKPQ